MYNHGDKVEYRLWNSGEWKLGIVYAETRDGVQIYVGGSIITCHHDNVRKPA